MDSWGWAIVLAAVAAVTAMLLMALYDEISRRRWIAKNGAERFQALPGIKTAFKKSNINELTTNKT